MPDQTSFIAQFMEHTKYYESPSSFWKWSAYTCIAGVMRDHCWRRLGDRKLYPNIYVLLLAPSAMYRKGLPVDLTERLVKSVANTKVISGRASIQAILDELARGETDKQTGKITRGGSALFSAPELSAGIVNDPEAIKILTDIYDFKEEYVSRLRGAGVFRIHNICFSMLGASNEELLKDLYTDAATYGGLLGRTFLIKADEFRPPNSLFDIRDTTASFQQLAEKLKLISQVVGEFEFTSAAQAFYEEWYAPFRLSYKDKPDKSGIAGRIHTSVIKLSMILCVNYTQNLTIDVCHIQEAISECTALMPNYTGFVMQSGKATTNECAAQLIEDIWMMPRKTLTKQEFLTRHFHQFDLDVLDKCVTTLVQAGLLQESVAGSEITYRITDKCKIVFGLTEAKNNGMGGGI